MRPSLKEGRPIVFPLSELGAGNRRVCIAWKREDGTVGLPAGFDGIAIGLSSRALDTMLRKPLEFDLDVLRFLVFRGRDEKAMGQEMRGLVGPKTKVLYRGFAPSDVPASDN